MEHRFEMWTENNRYISTIHTRGLKFYVHAGMELAMLQIRKGKRDNVEIIFHMSPLKHML